MSSSQSRLFVTGANGHLGRRVVELLLEGGAANVVAGSRHTDKLSDLSARGAELRRADFDDRATLNDAFSGIDCILIISAPDTPDDPPRRLRQHLAAVNAAVEAGVKRIVYTSMLNPEPGSPVPFAADHHETELAIGKSGVSFTILRPCWYADSVFMWLPQALASGKWTTAAGDGRTSYVWRDDLARTAAAALQADTTESCRLDVTGPEALSPADITALVDEIFGTPLGLVPVSAAERKQGLRAAGLPEVIAELVTSFDVNTSQGRLDVVSDTVERLTGRPPRSLREFLVENRDALLAAASTADR